MVKVIDVVLLTVRLTPTTLCYLERALSLSFVNLQQDWIKQIILIALVAIGLLIGNWQLTVADLEGADPAPVPFGRRTHAVTHGIAYSHDM